MQNPKVLGNISGHMTNAEKEERERQENLFSRENVLLQLPDYLDGDKNAQKIWCQVTDNAEDFKLFDNLDADTLGSYCCITSRIITLRAKYTSAVKGHRKNADIMDISKELRLLEALQLNYANKLGLTPESRARLAMKITEPEEDSDADLYG